MLFFSCFYSDRILINRYPMSSSHDDEQLDLESGLAKPHQHNNDYNASNNGISNQNANGNKEQHLASAESSPESAPDDSDSGTIHCYIRFYDALYS